jgi:hypothetical protein
MADYRANTDIVGLRPRFFNLSGTTEPAQRPNRWMWHERVCGENLDPQEKRPLMLSHEHWVRGRHGDWRAVCPIDRAAETVILERVEHRREIYR